VELNLPAEIKLGKLLGKGRRCTAFAAEYAGEQVAVKTYRIEAMTKCQHRYGMTAPAFEHSRNSDLYGIEAIRRFIARPIAVFGEGDGYSHAFIQQLVEGISLNTLIEQLGAVPPETVAALQTVVNEAHGAGLYDLDLGPKNIRVRGTSEGWQPMLFDFNMLPQYLATRSPVAVLLYKVGVLKPWNRDRRQMKGFEDWPNRARCYRVPLLGLKIRTRLLNAKSFVSAERYTENKMGRSDPGEITVR
jgi:hypothetical protein